MSMMTTVRFSGLAFGGDAVGRELSGPHQGRVVFVPGCAPSDIAEVRLIRAFKGHAFGVVHRMVESTQRSEPFCPYFGRCGGCQWQHVPLSVQHEEKFNFVRRTFWGLLTDQSTTTWFHGPDRRFRTRVRLVIRLGHENAGCGFFETSSHQIVPIVGCPVTSDTLSQGIADLADTLKTFPDVFASGTAVLMAGDNGVTASLRIPLPENIAAELVSNLAQRPGWAGVVLNYGPAHISAGDPVVRWRLDTDTVPWDLSVHATGFAQANLSIIHRLTTDLVSDLQPTGPTQSLLELFCGAGTFTISLARHFQIMTALDVASQAIDSLHHTLITAGLDHVTSAAVDLTTPIPLFPYLQSHPDVIVLDPPREGARSLMAPIAQSGAHRIAYISCDHTTQARDVRILVDSGYRLDTLRVYDMFPHTSHCETLAILSRDK